MLSDLQAENINVQGDSEATEITQQSCIRLKRKAIMRLFESARFKEEEPLPETLALATCNLCSSSKPTSAVR